MPVIDVDRETAREAAARELSKPIYPKSSLGERILAWISDLLHRLTDGASALPGAWLTIVVLVLLVVAALFVAVRIVRRTMGGRGPGRLYGNQALSADGHRARAEQSAAGGDWAGAIRHRVRAIGRQLEEDGVLGSVPGRTAGELARDAAAALPPLGTDFATAATIFNDVAYGDRPGTQAQYQLVSDLDDRLRTAAAR